MQFRSFAVLSASLASLVLACSASVTSSSAGSSGSSDETGGSHQPADPSPTDAATCTVTASTYDSSCTSDSDCVAVPVGGDTCTPCEQPSGNLVCPLAALNASVAGTYEAALHAGIAASQGTSTPACLLSSCPTEEVPRCVSGRCAIVDGLAYDAGQDTGTTTQATCTITASSYDTSCGADTDCVLVPPGGNTCEPCQAGTGAFECNLASINVADEPAYTSALGAGLQPWQNTTTFEQCIAAACPVQGTARCNAGTCTVVSGYPSLADAASE